MFISNTVGVALAELRSDLRLARTWIFILIALVFIVISYFNLTWVTWTLSGVSSYLGFSTPLSGIAQLGSIYVFLFTIAATFLAFDVQSRDRRDRIAEVINSRPITNVELLLGRAVGICTLFTVVVMIVFLLLKFIGVIGTWQDWVIQGSFEPYSLIAFLIFDLFPNYFFWTSIVIFLTIVLRFRLLVALVAVGLLVLQFQLFTQLPVHLANQFGVMGTGLLVSEINTFFVDFLSIAMRLTYLLLGIGFIYFAAAIHPRLDGKIRVRRTVGGIGMIVAAFLIAFGLAQFRFSDIDDRDRWRVAHTEAANKLVVDVKHIEGTVTIDPGSDLHVELQLNVSNPHTVVLEELLLSLNPSLEITELAFNGQNIDYEFENGLLRLTPTAPLSSEDDGILEITYQGLPNQLFAYLDGSIDFLQGSSFDAQILYSLGTLASVFDNNQVILMPAVAWYPVAGVNIDHDRLETHRRDFFTLELIVDVPTEWDVAGPSKRLSTENGDRTRHQFKPTAPLPEIALVAAEFVSRKTEIGGVQFEFLMTEEHLENLDLFSDVMPLIEEDIEEMLRKATKFGIPYPYDSLTLVEVTNQLRLFGGGWRMDSTFNMPGVIFVRESAFPTAIFDLALERLEGEQITDEQQRLEYKYAVVRTYFENDLHGGNLYEGVVRNLLNFQTEPTGNGATVLSFFTTELVKDLMFDYRGFYSAFQSTSQQSLQSNVQFFTVRSITDDEGTVELSEVFRDRVLNSPNVWERSIDTPLSQLDYRSNPEESLNVLALKVSLLADTVSTYFGDEAIGSIVAALRDQYGGTTYTVDEFNTILDNFDIPLHEIIGDWMSESGMPGFVASTPTLSRLNDQPNGEPFYETSISVKNDEPISGIVHLSYRELDPNQSSTVTNKLTPVRIGANSTVDFNIHSTAPIGSIVIDPMLSLNRKPIVVPIGEDAYYPDVDSEPKPAFVEDTQWDPDSAGIVIVDDLDEGFSTNFDPASTQLPAFLSFFGVQDPILDQGLPRYEGGSGFVRFSFGTWERATFDTAYGRYRRTTARTTKGTGLKHAYFDAQLPTSGKWELEYYYPILNVKNRRFDSNITSADGEYDIHIVQREEKRKVEFDASAALTGWNSLGHFDLEAGTVRVEVSDKSTGNVVWVDAVRWSDVNRPPANQ